MDRVHVVYERLHRLVHPAYSHIDGVLDDPLLPLDPEEVPPDVVINRNVLEVAVVGPAHVAYLVYLLVESLSHERCHIEVKCRDGLPSVHLVLHRLHGDAAENAGSLYPLCRPGLTMPCEEPVLQDLVQRMLHAGEALCRVIVLVVHMYI